MAAVTEAGQANCRQEALVETQMCMYVGADLEGEVKVCVYNDQTQLIKIQTQTQTYDSGPMVAPNTARSMNKPIQLNSL